MSHFVKKCECGRVIAQCKCMGDRIVITVSPCTHIVTTNSVASFEPISIESLYETYHKFLNEDPIPNVFRCHPSVYNDLRDYFQKKEAEEEAMGIVKPLTPELPYQEWSRIMGVDILIDRDLEVGEWRFERIIRTH
jgi:hypothetical protein